MTKLLIWTLKKSIMCTGKKHNVSCSRFVLIARADRVIHSCCIRVLSVHLDTLFQGSIQSFKRGHRGFAKHRTLGTAVDEAILRVRFHTDECNSYLKRTEELFASNFTTKQDFDFLLFGQITMEKKIFSLHWCSKEEPDKS